MLSAPHTDSGYRPVERIGSGTDRKSTRLNSSHSQISYAVFCLKKKKYNWMSTCVRARRPTRWVCRIVGWRFAAVCGARRTLSVDAMQSQKSRGTDESYTGLAFM